MEVFKILFYKKTLINYIIFLLSKFTVLIQNNNLKTAITGIEPQYNIGNRLEYRYDQETAFWAGNEFFNFENKDVRAATFAIKSIELKSLYHNYLYSNPARYDQPYTYNPDINGNFLINTLQGRTPLTEAEYVWIHFSLRHPKLLDEQSIHLYGNFNNYVIDNSTKLEWNTRTRRYELPYLLKQGFYNIFLFLNFKFFGHSQNLGIHVNAPNFLTGFIIFPSVCH